MEHTLQGFSIPTINPHLLIVEGFQIADQLHNTICKETQQQLPFRQPTHSIKLQEQHHLVSLLKNLHYLHNYKAHIFYNFMQYFLFWKEFALMMQDY